MMSEVLHFAVWVKKHIRCGLQAGAVPEHAVGCPTFSTTLEAGITAHTPQPDQSTCGGGGSL